MKPPRAALASCVAVIATISACAAERGVSYGKPSAPPVSFEGWQSETFPLPPAFAPGLPAGTESLLFPPGWAKPESENFWSYAFVMRIKEPAPDAARLRNLLEQYYNGLTASFAESKGKTITPAQVKVTRTSRGHFKAHMHLTDAFATFEPIDVRVLIETAAEPGGHASLCIRVSPQPEEHEVWRSLDAAIADILFRRDAGHEKPE